MNGYIIEKIANLNAYVHISDDDCEVAYFYVPVMSERHGFRIAAALGWCDYDQGQGGRFSRVWYSHSDKRIWFKSGWDI